MIHGGRPTPQTRFSPVFPSLCRKSLHWCKELHKELQVIDSVAGANSTGDRSMSNEQNPQRNPQQQQNNPQNPQQGGQNKPGQQQQGNQGKPGEQHQGGQNRPGQGGQGGQQNR
jgi:hypothetical protein